MSTTTEHTGSVSIDDRKAVDELILGLLEDARREERESRLLKATASWLSAFSSFKRLRKQAGFPQNRNGWLAYGSLLGAIKAGGKAILVQIECNHFDPTPVISAEAFTACVAEMIEDDHLLDGGYLERPTELEIEALFAST